MLDRIGVKEAGHTFRGELFSLSQINDLDGPEVEAVRE